jgi:fructose-1,6-bisphosphatase/inositol monophosphatase family enzyme
MKDKQKILDIIRNTRTISLPAWGNVDVLRNKGAGTHDVVTELDESIERLLASEFSKIEPDIQFVGEEFGGNRSAKRFWLVDPIDE